MAADPSPAYTTDPASGDPIYVYKPSLLGSPHEFRLTRNALTWHVGSRAGSVSYHDIERVRLSYRPMTLQTYRFRAEVWPRSGPKLQIASTSWRSMVELERQDRAYAAFLAKLHRRMADAGSRASFETGSPAVLYWPGLFVFVLVSPALAALVVQGLQAGATTGAAFVAIFLAAFLLQAGTFFRRNRPGTYRPDAIPAAVTPAP